MPSLIPPSRRRKSPTQARSVATLEVIHEATLQVLIYEGVSRCNTTRVAERAGVSVGSVYQYYPNRRALLSGVLERQLDQVCQEVESGCDRYKGCPLDEISDGVVSTFVSAKLNRADAASALYAISEDHGGAVLVAKARTRIVTSVAALLRSARDVSFDDPNLVSLILMSALSGPVRTLLEDEYPAARITSVRVQLMSLGRAYLWTQAERNSRSGC